MELTRPLNNLLKKDAPFVWTETHTDAVNKVIDTIQNAQILAPQDWSKQFVLEVDASTFALGVVLLQEDD